MDYIIVREDFIESLRKREDLSIDKKGEKLEEFDNIVLCPYKGHKIDLSKLTDWGQTRANEYKCPECDEWIWWNRNLPWFQQAPYELSSRRIFHPENYKCIVNPKYENPNYKPGMGDLIIWFDKNLNPIRPNTIPLNPGEKTIKLCETTYVAIKK